MYLSGSFVRNRGYTSGVFRLVEFGDLGRAPEGSIRQTTFHPLMFKTARHSQVELESALMPTGTR